MTMFVPLELTPLRWQRAGGAVVRDSQGRPVLEFVGIKRKDNDEWDFMIDEKNKIGYIRLTVFADNSARDLFAVMEDLTQKGIKGFILDLRFDPGGLLDMVLTEQGIRQFR